MNMRVRSFAFLTFQQTFQLLFVCFTPTWKRDVCVGACVLLCDFLVHSGLLVMFLTLKHLDANGGSIKWYLFYIHRFLR